MLEKLEKSLIAYASAYYTGDEDFDRNIRLKLAHSFRVRNEARRILEAEDFFSDRALILRAALLHDCGRFEQFKRFRTFSDAVSIDHGDLSAETALEHGFLADLAPEERSAAERAVRAHNKLAIPADFPARERQICRVVRDADKTDILQILLGHLRNPENPAIVFALDPAQQLTPEVAAELFQRRIPKHGMMKTRLDFLASKFNWVYDLNFPASHRIWLERGLLAGLRALLPPLPELDILYENAQEYQRLILKGAVTC